MPELLDYCYIDESGAAQVSPKELITFTDNHLYTHVPTYAHKLCKIMLSVNMNPPVYLWIILHILSAYVGIFI